ncbi:hypothetical protein ABIB25_000506 [Nakamurella sp. UYEF19]
MDVDDKDAGHRPDDASDTADPFWEPGPAQAAINAVSAAVDGLLI